MNELSSDIVESKSILLKKKKSNENKLKKEVREEPKVNKPQIQTHFYMTDSLKMAYNSFNKSDSEKLVYSLVS